MSRDSSYKKPGQTIVTVPLDPGLHKKLRVRAAQEGTSIKVIVTRLIATYVGDTGQETGQ